MGPNRECLAFADHLIKEHCLTVDRIALAYSIQAYVEADEPDAA